MSSRVARIYVNGQSVQSCASTEITLAQTRLAAMSTSSGTSERYVRSDVRASHQGNEFGFDLYRPFSIAIFMAL